MSAGGREADPPPFTPLPPPKPSAPRTAPRSRAPLTSLPRPPRPPGRGPPRRRPPGPLGRCLGPALGHVAAALPGSRTARGTPGYNWTANRTACRDRTRRKQFSPSRRPLLTPAPPRSASACRSSAGAKTPHSVTMPPVMRSWGVTSKAGFHTSIPGDSGGGGKRVEATLPRTPPPYIAPIRPIRDPLPYMDPAILYRVPPSLIGPPTPYGSPLPYTRPTHSIWEPPPSDIGPPHSIWDLPGPVSTLGGGGTSPPHIGHSCLI